MTVCVCVAGVRQARVYHSEGSSHPLRDTAGSDHYHRRHGAAGHLHQAAAALLLRQQQGRGGESFISFYSTTKKTSGDTILLG